MPAPAPALPRPLLAGARLAQPPPGPPAPARQRGAPSLSRPAKEVGPGRRARQLASREKFAAPPRRGPRPWRPRSRPAGDFLGSSSARAAAPNTGTAGRPESARGLCAPGLRVSWLGARCGSVVGAPGLGGKACTEPLLRFGAGGESTHQKCEGWRGADMPPAREPYPWEPSGSRGRRRPAREGVGGRAWKI